MYQVINPNRGVIMDWKKAQRFIARQGAREAKAEAEALRKEKALRLARREVSDMIQERLGRKPRGR
jgi:hypothetical protein